MQPDSPQQWIETARARAADADCLTAGRKASNGSVYLAGYAIECSLKALLQSRGKSFPRSGNQGHDLKGLWSAARFRRRDLQDPSGAKAFFLESWSTSLRYQSTLDHGHESPTLVEAARSLAGWIQTQVRRSRRRGGGSR